MSKARLFCQVIFLDMALRLVGTLGRVPAFLRTIRPEAVFLVVCDPSVNEL
jgi:hypothetical protein